MRGQPLDSEGLQSVKIQITQQEPICCYEINYYSGNLSKILNEKMQEAKEDQEEQLVYVGTPTLSEIKKYFKEQQRWSVLELCVLEIECLFWHV